MRSSAATAASLLFGSTLLALVAGCASAPRTSPNGWLLQPVPSDIAYTVRDGTVSYAEAGVIVSVHPLRHEERMLYLQRELGELMDPFALPGVPEAYTVFEVELRNHTTGPLFFSPIDAALLLTPADLLTPLEYTGLSLEFWRRPGGPELLDRLVPLLYDTGITLERGERVKRLLVFGRLPDKLKAARLELSIARGSLEYSDFVFPFTPSPAPPSFLTEPGGLAGGGR